MSELTKQALKVENNMSFPNNNAGLITPTALRTFNEDMIDSTVSQIQYTADSASFQAQINALDPSSSAESIIALEQFTASADQRLDSLEAATSSYATNSVTGSSLITASFASQNLTFTKGDGSQFTLFIPDNSGSILPSGVVSGSAQITSLGFVSSSITGSSVITASFDNNTRNLTFTKGDSSTFAVNIPDVSGSIIDTGSFVTNIQNTALVPLTFQYDTAGGSGFNVTLDLPSGVVSGSGQITPLLPSGVVSGSSQIDYPQISNIPNGIVSGSSQINYPQISNIPSGIVSGSSQVSYTGLSNIPAGIVSGAAQVTPLLPSGTVSGSQQVVDILSSVNAFTQSASGRLTNLEAFTSSQQILNGTFATTGSNVFVGNQTINGNLNLTGSLTASGLNYPTTDNGAKSFIQTDGNGNLSLQYVQSVYETIRNMSGVTLAKGTPVYISGSTGDNGNAYIADASDDTKMPATYIVGEDLTPGQTGLALVQGKIEGVNTTGYTAGTEIYVAEGGGWSSSRPSGSASIVQKLGVVTKEGVGGQGIVINQLQAELPNLPQGLTWVGNSGNQPIAVQTGSLSSYIFTQNNTFTGTQTFNNIAVNGTASIAYLESVTGSAKIIGDAFIVLNNDTPTERYAGIIVVDSGSTNTTASFQFDGLTNDWFYEYTGSDPLNFGVALFGPDYGTKGSPLYPTNNRIQKGDGGHHLLDTNISDDGSTVSINSNTQITGSLLVNGNAPLINTNLLPLNAFTASQQVLNATFATTASFNTYTESVDGRLDNIELTTASLQSEVDNLQSVTGSYATTASFNSFTESVDGRLDNLELTTASLQAEVDNLQSVTGSYATTGSNIFTGDQTLTDAAGNTVTLSDASGSLMLVAKTFTSASTHLTASAGNQVNIIFKNNNNTTDTTISGSNNIFTNPSAPTADYKRIVGSNNIVNSAAGMPQVTGSMTTPITMASNYFGSGTTTIRGPITGSLFTISNNAIFGTTNLGQAGVNDLTRVSAFTFTGNQVIGTMTFGASTSATLPTLASTPSVTNNIVNGAMQATMNSSSLTFQNNIVNAGSFIIANNHFTTAAGTGLTTVNNNLVGGVQFTNLTVQGANPAGTTNNPAFNGNISYGISNAAHINGDLARVSGTNAYTHLSATAILGGNLAVTGSSLTSDTTSIGSAFVGRFNANDGRRNKTSDIVFAVGTGTATGTRKTGLLVDSGSNTFVEGSLNVSGSSSFTGSVGITGTLTASLQEGYVLVGNNLGITSAIPTSSIQTQIPSGTISGSVQITELGFAITGSNSFVGNQVITGSLTVSGSFTSSLQEGHIFVGDGSGRTTTIATSSLSSVPFPYTGSAQVTGSLGITGSMSGFVNTLSVASSTASVNFSDGNMFVITLTGGATTHFTPSNIKAGQTINIQISQPSGASTGSVTFSPNVKFAGGNDYQVTATGSAIDLLTFVSLDGTNVLGTSIKNFL